MVDDNLNNVMEELDVALKTVFVKNNLNYGQALRSSISALSLVLVGYLMQDMEDNVDNAEETAQVIFNDLKTYIEYLSASLKANKVVVN